MVRSSDIFSRREILAGVTGAAGLMMSSEGRAALQAVGVRRLPNTVDTIVSHMNGGYYDVVIYGGTIAGICAARTAVQNGMKTLLLEPTAWIGGMSGPGNLTPVDGKYRDKVGGTFWQMIQQIAKLEATATRSMPTTQFPSNDPSSPNYYSAAMVPCVPINLWTTLYQFAFTSGADILINAPIETVAGSLLPSVVMSGSSITQLNTAYGPALGKMFIDASYEGDVLAGVATQGWATYTVGRESSAQYGESGAGYQPGSPVSISGVNFLNGGSPYYPLQFAPSLNFGDADNRVQGYNYRPQVALAATNATIPFFQPPGYDPTQFALLAAIATASGYTKLTDCCTLYLCNGFTDNYNDGGVGYPNSWYNNGANYADATPAVRQAIIAGCKAFIAGLLYFAANDTSMPAAVRSDAQLYGYPTKNFVQNQSFPWQMYVREGRRMVGSAVITQAGIFNGATVSHPIGWTTYPWDCHACGAYATSDGTGYILDGAFFNTNYGNGQIPMEALMPQVGQCGNFLSVVCASYTHVGWSSGRLETGFAVQGDAGGVMAAAKVRTGKAIQNLDYTTDVVPGLNAVYANFS